MTQDKIGVIARMEWLDSLKLLPAMGCSSERCKVVLDRESPQQLGNGLLKHVISMVVIHEAKELFVIGSSESQTYQDVVDRVNSLRASDKLPDSIPIHGLLYNPATCRLDLVFRGYEERKEHEVL